MFGECQLFRQLMLSSKGWTVLCFRISNCVGLRNRRSFFALIILCTLLSIAILVSTILAAMVRRHSVRMLRSVVCAFAQRGAFMKETICMPTCLTGRSGTRAASAWFKVFLASPHDPQSFVRRFLVHALNDRLTLL